MTIPWVTHELVIHDEGTDRESVGLRSNIALPPMEREHLAEILYQESILPIALTDRVLIRTMEAHEEHLARTIGRKWMERK